MKFKFLEDLKNDLRETLKEDFKNEMGNLKAEQEKILRNLKKTKRDESFLERLKNYTIRYKGNKGDETIKEAVPVLDIELLEEQGKIKIDFTLGECTQTIKGTYYSLRGYLELVEWSLREIVEECNPFNIVSNNTILYCNFCFDDSKWEIIDFTKEEIIQYLIDRQCITKHKLLGLLSAPDYHATNFIDREIENLKNEVKELKEKIKDKNEKPEEKLVANIDKPTVPDTRRPEIINLSIEIEVVDSSSKLEAKIIELNTLRELKVEYFSILGKSKQSTVYLLPAWFNYYLREICLSEYINKNPEKKYEIYYKITGSKKVLNNHIECHWLNSGVADRKGKIKESFYLA